ALGSMAELPTTTVRSIVPGVAPAGTVTCTPKLAPWSPVTVPTSGMPSSFVSSNGDPSDARSETCHPLWDVATIFRTSGCPPVFRTLIAAVTVCPGVTLKYGPAATKTPAGGTKVVALVADEAEGRLTEFAMMVATSALPSTAATGTSTVAVRVMAQFDGNGPGYGTQASVVSVTTGRVDVSR